MTVAAIHERQYYAQQIGATVRLVVDGTVHSTDGAGGNPSPLTIGARYALCCPDTGVYVRQGGPGVVATSSDEYLARSQFRIVTVDGLGSNRIAVTSATGGGGFLYLTRIDDPRGAPATQKAIYFASFLGTRVNVAVGDISGTSTALVHGARYMIYCPEIDPAGVLGQLGDDVWVRQGASGIVVSDAGDSDQGMPLPQGVAWTLNVDDATNDHVAVLSASSGNGSSLFIVRIDSVL